MMMMMMVKYGKRSE